MPTSTELKQEGNAAFSAGRYQEALTVYEKAIELDPENIDLLNNASAAVYKMGKYDEALAYARKSLRVSENVKGRVRAGAALWSLNRLTEALVEYDRASSLSPGDTRIEENRQTLLRLLEQSLRSSSTSVIPSSGVIGVALDIAVVAFAVLTVLCFFFMPGRTQGIWKIFLLVVIAQQAKIAHQQGLLVLNKEVMMSWGNYRSTLQLLLAALAWFSNVVPQMMLVNALAIYCLLSLSSNQPILERFLSVPYRFCSSYLQWVSTNKATVCNYAATLEAVMLFAVMFTGGAIFTLVYIQYVKNLYRIDGSVRAAFAGIRMNVSRLTRHRYMPAFVDTYMQKFCDMIYLMSQQNM